MIAGICNLPLVPMRSESSDCSEMTTQVVFGELFEIVETVESWSRIRLLSDGYTGWCTSKMLQILPAPIFEKYKQTVPVFTKSLLSACSLLNDNIPQLFLPAGSRLYFYDSERGRFPIYRTTNADSDVPELTFWTIDPSSVTNSYGGEASGIARTAHLFLNAPYLWGGKSILGIDCSGMVQIVCSIHGMSLPRNASDQAQVGNRVPDLSHSIPGDLAFFARGDGKVVHVGILIDDHTIIHASGCVHIDAVDQTGIFSESLGLYTHQLHSIRRL